MEVYEGQSCVSIEFWPQNMWYCINDNVKELSRNLTPQKGGRPKREWYNLSWTTQ